MRRATLIVGTIVIMIASGAVTSLATLRVLMWLGLKYHNNYEHYGLGPSRYIIPILGLIAFAIPGIVAWRLYNRAPQVSLRTLLVVMTFIALLLGTIMYLIRITDT